LPILSGGGQREDGEEKGWADHRKLIEGSRQRRLQRLMKYLLPTCSLST
jgi:hypothetical protein